MPVRNPANRRTASLVCALFLSAANAAADTGLTLDISSRESVRNFYNALFVESDFAEIGWTGAVSNCAPGVPAPAYRAASLLRINVIRAFAGVPAAVILDEGFNAKAQSAALMMSAQNALSHFPDRSWACASDDGIDGAGHSNLSLGQAGPAAIAFGQLQDDGENNAAVGHRRWLLMPQTQMMGIGDVAGDGSSKHPPANAVWVLDDHIADPRPVTRNDFVAWPPPGYVPYTLVFARWSLSYPDADFSAARVRMTRGTADVPVVLEPPVTGAGENTLVWRPTAPELSDPAALRQADQTVSVDVDGVQVGGQTRRFTYTVTTFDPARTDTDTILPVVAGPTKLAPGESASYSLHGSVPGADGRQWGQAAVLAAPIDAGAESGFGFLSADVSAGSVVINTDQAASGRHSFNLAGASVRAQTLTVDRWLVPTATGRLRFASELQHATEFEVARVQISVDAGRNWQTLYAQTGQAGDGPVELFFTQRVVPLGEYAGRLLRLRFSYDITDRSHYRFYAPGAGVGWYLDDVGFDGVDFVAAPTVTAADDVGQLMFSASTAGTFGLTGRATIKGIPLEWGPVTRVAVDDGSQGTVGTGNSGGENPTPTPTPTPAEPETPAPAPLRLLSPNGGEALKVGQKLNVLWASTGVAAKTTLQLQFSKNGAKWTTLKSIKNTGRTVWKLTGAQRGAAVQMRLCGPQKLGASRCDTSDAVFTVTR